MPQKEILAQSVAAWCFNLPQSENTTIMIFIKTHQHVQE